MKVRYLPVLAFCLLAALLGGLSPAALAAGAAVADVSQMAAVEEVAEEGMIPVFASDLRNGSYDITVESSSSMFRVERCVLTVADGEMSAVMTMGGKGYLYVCPGTAEEAAEADASAFIPFAEDEDGAHCFTIPVPALDEAVPCAAFSKSKELWYARTLLFRADSLPLDAFRDGVLTTSESLGLRDGAYTVAVTLTGGSGRASVASPAQLTVKDGAATAEIIWSSKNYDYMRVGEEKLLPVNTEGNAAFLVPVLVFDRAIAVVADTVAMSEPHEIEYRLRFDSESLEALP